MKKTLYSFIALILSFSMVFSTVGCTQADTVKVVNLVISELPVALQLAQTILALTNSIAVVNGVDQTTINDINNGGKEAQADLQLLADLAKEYTANPNAKTFDAILSVVDKLVVTADTSVLNVSHIKDPATRQKVEVYLASLDTVLHIIDGYLLARQTPAQIQARVAARTVKVAAVASKWDKAMINQKAQPFGMDFNGVVAYETGLGL